MTTIGAFSSGATKMGAELGNVELAVLDLVEQVVGKIARCLVDLVDQDQRSRRPGRHRAGAAEARELGCVGRDRTQDRQPERLPADELLRRRQLALLRRVELRLRELADAVELVEKVDRLARALGVEAEHRPEAELGRHAVRELGLARSGIARHQQRHAQGQGHVDGTHEVVASDVAGGILERVDGRGGRLAGNRPFADERASVIAGSPPERGRAAAAPVDRTAGAAASRRR